jgi:hypothetical protein
MTPVVFSDLKKAALKLNHIPWQCAWPFTFYFLTFFQQNYVKLLMGYITNKVVRLIWYLTLHFVTHFCVCSPNTKISRNILQFEAAGLGKLFAKHLKYNTQFIYWGRCFLLWQLLNCHNSCNCQTLTPNVILFGRHLSLIGGPFHQMECFTGAKHSSIPAETFFSLNSITR